MDYSVQQFAEELKLLFSLNLTEESGIKISYRIINNNCLAFEFRFQTTSVIQEFYFMSGRCKETIENLDYIRHSIKDVICQLALAKFLEKRQVVKTEEGYKLV